MFDSRISARALIATAVLFTFILFLPGTALHARVRLLGFVIPSRMLPLSQAATPAEYAELQSAIKANWEREKDRQVQTGPGLGSDFDHIYATRIQLGALGEAMVVYFANSPECGATGNCPMAVYVRERNGYHRVIEAGGWGAALLPSSVSVPDIAFYWHMSAAETDSNVLHYLDGKFVGQGGPACTDTNSSNPVCAAMASALGISASHGISPADYQALRPQVEADLKKQSPPSSTQFSFDQAHAMDFLQINQTVLTVVGLGTCGIYQNCSISIYAHNYGRNSYWPLLRNATGWAVSTDSNVSTGIRVIIARSLSPNRAELTEYRLIPRGLPTDWGSGSHLTPSSCEIIMSKTGEWPAEWNPAGFTVQPVSCFQSPSVQNVQIPAADPTDIFEAAQDSTGRVWAISSGFSPKLYRWESGAWISVATNEANGMSPRGLWPGPNGGALALYSRSGLGSSQEILVWLHGDQTKILAHLPATTQAGMLDSFAVQAAVAAPLGTVLIAGNGSDFYRGGVLVHQAQQVLYRLDANGQLQQIYSIAPSQYVPHFHSVEQESITPMPLSTARSSDGKIWIWSHFSFGNTAGEKVFNGFLITDGKTVEPRLIPRLPTEHLEALAPWDKNHFAAAEYDEGFYTINTSTLKVRPVPEPQPGAFRFVQQIFSAGDDHYVLCSRTGGPALFDEFFDGTLWRFHNGQWEEVMDNIERASRTGLVTPDGFWLATMDRGLWFFPSNGQPRKIDWRNGLSLASANRIFRLADGEVLATNAGTFTHTRSVAFAPQELLSAAKTSSGFTVIYALRKLQPDRNGNVWGLVSTGVLGEWNGNQWVSHPLPSVIQVSGITRIDIDTTGRVWLFPNCRLGPMGIFNPDADNWTTYGNYRFALSRQSQPVTFLHPDDDPMRPIYGPDSRIVFVGPCSGLNYFDGSQWQLWRNNQLPGAGQRDLGIPPFFDDAGNLAIDLHRNTWEWNPPTGWTETQYEPQQRHPEPSFQIALNRGPVQDSEGRSWWVAEDSLYVSRGQNKRLILSGSAPQPFIDGRQLVRVLLDARGNAFLETPNFFYVILPASAFADTRQHTSDHSKLPNQPQS